MDTLPFKKVIEEGYAFEKESLIFGGAMLDKQPISGLQVKIPLKTINRHGVISGATGTGKTKSLQLFAEQLSLAGVPSVTMDIKGDLSGLAQPGSMNKHVKARIEAANIGYEPQGMPVELMSLDQKEGVHLKASISEFGPVLLSKMLELNETQGSILAVLFKYCDDRKLPLLNIPDLKKLLQYTIGEGREEIQKEYGNISSSSINAILRKLIQLEEQGGDLFFGEPSFRVQDFMRTDAHGRGYISILRLMDLQNKPKLFSTFMLCLLSEIYGELPEEGDLDQPKLVFFIDEAHLLFENATSALLDQIEVIIKLIRSKGVGIYFVTQNPEDIPEDILGQCGMKIQHALRAFTAKDRKQIRQASQNFPLTEFYDTDQLLTELGVGEALITCLNEDGAPTPLAHTLMRPPLTRMDVLTSDEVQALEKKSALIPKYNIDLDSESASEILIKKIEAAQKKEGQEALLAEEMKKAGSSRSKEKDDDPGIFQTLSKNTMVRQIGRTIFRELTRGILGVLGAK